MSDLLVMDLATACDRRDGNRTFLSWASHNLATGCRYMAFTGASFMMSKHRIPLKVCAYGPQVSVKDPDQLLRLRDRLLSIHQRQSRSYGMDERTVGKLVHDVEQELT